jgi:thiosulfate dehydrogenase
MGKFLLGFIIGIVAFPVLVGLYLYTGAVPAGVSDHAFPLEKYIAGAALNATINKEAPKRDLSTFTKEDLIAGAQVYRRAECMECHGGPPQFGQPETHMLYPPAPLLFTPDGTVTDDPVGVSYWKVKNGIRLSGMPSYKEQLTENEMWQVAALVASADKLPQESLQALKPPAQVPASAAPPQK